MHPVEVVPGQLEPATTYAFKPSGENAAAVAFERKTGMTIRPFPPQPLQMITRFGESTVSDKITVEESGDMAKTRPNTPAAWETDDPENTITPWLLKPAAVLSTPRYESPAAFPVTNEFGVTGKFTAEPTVKVPDAPWVRVKSLVVHASVVPAQAVVVV